MSKPRYFLSASVAGETTEREVSVEEFCRAERDAGFRPKPSVIPVDDPTGSRTPATGGFSSGAISGRVAYVPDGDGVEPASSGEDSLEDVIEIDDVHTPTPTVEGALAVLTAQPQREPIDPEWDRVQSTQTLEPGYYWEALEAVKAHYVRKGDALLLIDVIEFENRVHSVTMRCHPRHGEREFTMLVEDFVRAFEPCPNGEQIRQREQQEVMQRVSDLQNELMNAQANPQLMIEAVRSTVEKAVEEDASNQGYQDKKAQEALTKRQRNLGKTHRRAARRSAAAGNPLAVPRVTLSSDVASIVSGGVDVAGVEQMALAAKTHAIVAEAQVKWLDSKTREISDTIRALTPYINERAAVAIARSAGALKTAKRLREGIASLDLYTGKNVDVFDVRTGDGAPESEPLMILQSKRFMDEELAVWADIRDNFDFTDKKSFFQALASNDGLMEQVLPAPRCVVSIAVTRKSIDYGNAVTNLLYNLENQLVFLLVRNGGNVHVVYSAEPSHEAALRLFPTEDDMQAPFRGLDGSTISIRDVDFGKSAERFNDLALVYKRFLILLCGLDHRLQLFGRFYPVEEQMSFMTARFQQEHFRFVCDDEAGALLGDQMPDLSTWMEKHNGMIQSGSRVFVLAGGVMQNAPELKRRESLKLVMDEFKTPFIATKDGANFVIKALAQDIDYWTSKVKSEINVKCALEAEGNGWRSGLWWLCVDGVSLEDVQRYRHSRVHRTMGVGHLRMMRRVEAYLIDELQAQSESRAYLLEMATTLGGIPADQAGEVLNTAIRNWRAARRGAELPSVSDKAALNEVLSLMIPEGVLPGSVDDMLEAYVKASGVTPVLLTRTGRDKLMLYVLASDADRAAYPDVLRWGWVKRITLTAGKTKMRETGYSLVWLGTILPASETEIRRWPELANWMHPVDEPISLRHYAQIKQNLEAAQEWRDVLAAGRGVGIPEDLFNRLHSSCLEAHERHKGSAVLTTMLAIPLAVYVLGDQDRIEAGPITVKQKLHLAYACMRGESALYLYGDEQQSHTVKTRYLRRSHNKSALMNDLGSADWMLRAVSSDLLLRHDKIGKALDHAAASWSLREVKTQSRGRMKSAFFHRLSNERIELSMSRSFEQLMGRCTASLRKAFHVAIEEQVKHERIWPFKEKDERRAIIADLKARKWSKPWKGEANALAWDAEGGFSPANALFRAPLIGLGSKHAQLK